MRLSMSLLLLGAEVVAALEGMGEVPLHPIVDFLSTNVETILVKKITTPAICHEMKRGLVPMDKVMFARSVANQVIQPLTVIKE